MSADISIDFRFSTPICGSKLTGFDEHQRGLTEYILRLRETTQGIQSSNYKGWHSERNLHLAKNADMQWLSRKISLNAIKAIQKLSGDEQGVDIRLREVWANINESGSWNVPHIHPVRWAGVVYVQGESSPRKGADAQQLRINDGDTVFFNPVAEAAYFGQPHNANYHAEPGYVLMFPGYLLHMVIPHDTDQERITVAFNIDMVKLESQKRSEAKTIPIPPEHARPRVNVIT